MILLTRIQSSNFLLPVGFWVDDEHPDNFWGTHYRCVVEFGLDVAGGDNGGTKIDRRKWILAMLSVGELKRDNGRWGGEVPSVEE
jgi:hypothetical protein